MFVCDLSVICDVCSLISENHQGGNGLGSRECRVVKIWKWLFWDLSKTGSVWKSFQGEVNDFEGPVFGWFFVIENWIGLKVISGWGERFWGSRFWLLLVISKTGPVWKSFQGEVKDFEGPVFGWFWWSPKLDRFESHFRERWTILRAPFLVHLRISKTGSVWKSFQGEVNDLEGPVLEIFNVYSCVHNSSLWGPPMPCGCNLVLWHFRFLKLN